VRNHTRNFVRAWHGHRHERKWVTVLSGAALICCIAVDDWDNPSKDLSVQRFVLSEGNPALLEIPGGFVNGSMSLTDGAAICYFSDSLINSAAEDDIRFDARFWDPWEVQER